MSEIKLATAIDRLEIANEAFVGETAEIVTLSELNLASAKEPRSLISQASLTARVYDSANEDWSQLELVEEFAPYRITFTKPTCADNELLILSKTAFASFLQGANTAPIWRVARLGATIVTEGRTYTDWHHKVEAPVPAKKKSPRSLVREASSNRIVPPSVAPWTLIDSSFVPQSEAAIVWANASVAACLRSLADDIDSETAELKFKGPPRLTLKLSEQPGNHFEALGQKSFSALQDATAWVFENEREAEVRHILFACEIARSSGASDNELASFGKNLLPAFDGAKIAYQMSIAEVGKDTLKSLADLRKSVTEDTSKVTEGTRQVAAAVAGALALGFGLIAARLSTSTPHWLLITVMSIVVVYVLTIIFSGWDFIRLQRTLRLQWQSRLYRFLPQAEYDLMVANPTAHAERTFKWTAFAGGVAVALLALAIAFDWAGVPISSASSDEAKGASGKQALKPTENPVTSSLAAPPVAVQEKKQTAQTRAASAAAASSTAQASTKPSKP